MLKRKFLILNRLLVDDDFFPDVTQFNAMTPGKQMVENGDAFLKRKYKYTKNLKPGHYDTERKTTTTGN
jgi:hypothetical protein